MAAVNAPARAYGIAPGLSFSDACARAPALISEEIDRTGDAAGLKTVAALMTRWTPLAAVDGLDGVMLDVTGCAHLFGGEAAMVGGIARRLDEGGITARLGLAGTPGAAWALAHEGASGTILPQGGEADGLKDLPVAGLRLSPDALRLLRRFGLTRIGQLYDVDRKSLARRFQSAEAVGAALLRLDQALGRRSEPVDPLRLPPDYAARQPCPEPLGHLDGVREGLERLLGKLAGDLAAHGVGARDFTLSAYRADGTVSRTGVSASRAVREAAHIARLFRDRLERVDPGFGIDLLVLEARRTEPMGAGARPLSVDLAASALDESALAALADRIGARLGEGAVRVIEPAESHLPERAEAAAPFEGRLPDWSCIERAPQGPRPLRMFDQPEAVETLAEVPDGPPLRFVWRRVARRVMRADGPERIAPEWWRKTGGGAKPRARDYYRVEDQTGRRYWLFREGLYDDGRGGAPQWFVHGLFG